MQHDASYKRLFAFRLMVEHLLRVCVPDDLLATADLSSLRKLSAEYVSDELLKRHGDTVWRLRLRGRWMFLLVLLEFQSEDDRWMALRILTYTGLLYQELIRNEAPEVAAGRLPAVLPVVLYNGAGPWTAAREMGEVITPSGPWLAPFQPAQRYHLLDLKRVAADDLPRANLLRAVAGLEQSRSPEDLLRVVAALQRWCRHPDAVELQRAFADWVRQVVEREVAAGTVLPPLRTLEDVSMEIEERTWSAGIFEEAREKGHAEGREQGIKQGIKEGIEQGIEQQRELLCRMVAARFGADTAAHLVGVLAPIAEPERLAEIGDWLVRCETRAQFLARVDPESQSVR